MRTFSSLAIRTAFALALIVAPLCALVTSPGCAQRQLDRTGHYGSGAAAVGLTPDASAEAKEAAGKVLFTADQWIGVADKTFTLFIAWEADNREALARWPEIGEEARRIAKNKDDWLREAFRFRDAYAVNPVAEKATALQNSLSLLQLTLATVLEHMATTPQTP